MNKKKGILTLIAFIVILAGLGYVSVFGVGENKSGSASRVKQGLDLAGGVSITYQVVGEEEPSSADMSDTIYKLQKRVENYPRKLRFIRKAPTGSILKSPVFLMPMRYWKSWASPVPCPSRIPQAM